MTRSCLPLGTGTECVRCVCVCVRQRRRLQSQHAPGASLTYPPVPASPSPSPSPPLKGFHHHDDWEMDEEERRRHPSILTFEESEDDPGVDVPIRLASNEGGLVVSADGAASHHLNPPPPAGRPAHPLHHPLHARRPDPIEQQLLELEAHAAAAAAQHNVAMLPPSPITNLPGVHPPLFMARASLVAVGGAPAAEGPAPSALNTLLRPIALGALLLSLPPADADTTQAQALSAAGSPTRSKPTSNLARRKPTPVARAKAAAVAAAAAAKAANNHPAASSKVEVGNYTPEPERPEELTEGGRPLRSAARKCRAVFKQLAPAIAGAPAAMDEDGGAATAGGVVGGSSEETEDMEVPPPAEQAAGRKRRRGEPSEADDADYAGGDDDEEHHSAGSSGRGAAATAAKRRRRSRAKGAGGAAGGRGGRAGREAAGDEEARPYVQIWRPRDFKVQRDSTSNLKGVSRHKNTGKFEVSLNPFVTHVLNLPPTPRALHPAPTHAKSTARAITTTRPTSGTAASSAAPPPSARAASRSTSAPTTPRRWRRARTTRRRSCCCRRGRPST